MVARQASVIIIHTALTFGYWVNSEEDNVIQELKHNKKLIVCNTLCNCFCNYFCLAVSLLSSKLQFTITS